MATAAPEATEPLVRCGNCGFPVPEAEALLTDAAEAIDGLERDLRVKRAAIKRLEGEAADRLERHKHYSAACEVLAYWKDQLAPKAREVISEARLKPTIARLSSGHTVEGLKGCVDGYARFPYVVNAKRCSTGLDSQRYVDVGLIFRDAAHVEEGLRLAKRSEAVVSPSTSANRLDWRQVRRDNHRLILTALRQYAGVIEVERRHESDCPRCKRQIVLFDPADHPESLLRCYGCGMDEAMFLRALRDTDAPPAPDPKLLKALDMLEEMRSRIEALPA